MVKHQPVTERFAWKMSGEKKKKKNPSFWDVATLANDNQILASEWTAHGLISTMIGSLTFQVLDRRKSHEHNVTTVMDDVPETASTGKS